MQDMSVAIRYGLSRHDNLGVKNEQIDGPIQAG